MGVEGMARHVHALRETWIGGTGCAASRTVLDECRLGPTAFLLRYSCTPDCYICFHNVFATVDSSCFELNCGSSERRYRL